MVLQVVSWDVWMKMLIRKATKDDTDTIVAIIAPYVDQVIAMTKGAHALNQKLYKQF